MGSRRRSEVENSQTRELLLDAAEKLMREGGYPAVTTRRLAAEVGVSNQLVHYYFRTMDDLFLAVMRRHADLSQRALLQALAADNPVRALWELNSDPEMTRLSLEVMALANHRKVISEEAARHAAQRRALETEALSRVMSSYGIDQHGLPPVFLSLLLSSIPRTMVMETTMGMSLGHKETKALVEQWLGVLSKGRPLRAAASKRRKRTYLPRRRLS
jgi:TetR/AcrR family transcriptional regulator